MAGPDHLDAAEIRRLLRTLGARPSKSAEEARQRQIEQDRAMSVEQRMLLSLSLGDFDELIRRRSTDPTPQ